MKLVLYLLVGQCVVLIGNQGKLANALIGVDVRRVNENEFPYIASLSRFEVDDDNDVEIQHFCTGTLVSRKDVLTAEHCLRASVLSDVRIIIGSVDVRLGRRYTLFTWLSYIHWAEVRNYSVVAGQHDIAIARLAENVDENVPAIPLTTLTASELYGLKVVSAGWGSPTTFEYPLYMETVVFTVLTNSECEKTVKKIHGKNIPFHERMLCSSAMPPAIVTYGDSGGPLMYNNTLVGVTFGTCLYRGHPAHPGKLNVHSSVDFYKNFIHDFVNNF